MTLVLTADTNPGTATWADASTIGSGTIIPAGGSITGVYQGSVIGLGNLTITGPITVGGDLIVHGNLINAQGHDVVVRGDLIVSNDVLFSLALTPGTQADITVYGDFVFGNQFLYSQESGGAPSTVTVNGNLTGQSIFANGATDGSDGALFNIKGNVILADLQADGTGSSTVGTNGGAGGQVLVAGSLTLSSFLSLNGGFGSDTNAGQGGVVNVQGFVAAGDAEWTLRGGSATNGNAGDGGTLNVHASASISEIIMAGGDCTSDSELHRAGSGGSCEIDGDFACDLVFNARGGDRYGTLTISGSQPSPDGGFLDVYGTGSFEDIFMEGGDVFTTGFAPHRAGDGGSLNMDGNLSVSDDLQVNGGFAQVGDGGFGGSIFVEGGANIDDDLESAGGSSNLGNGGSGGTIDINGGDLTADFFNMDGGSAIEGNGGNGATVNCEGRITLTGDFSGQGGSCTSANAVHNAGRGASIDCQEFSADEYTGINLAGGDRSGATTVSDLTPLSPDAGTFRATGTCKFASFYGVGGNVTTDYPNCIGGRGSILEIRGTFTASGIVTYGGSGVGPSGGGNAGTLSVIGFSTISNFSSIGGNANDSILGGDAGTNGAGGTAIFYDGVRAGGLYMADGAGAGAAAVDITQLLIAGSVVVNEIGMTDRVGSLIYPVSGEAVVLKVNTMTGKQTFNNWAGTASGNVAARLTDSIFLTDATTGSWYYVQGTSI